MLAQHVPKLRGLSDAYHPDLARLVLPYAQRAGSDLQNPHGGAVRFEPDHYLEIWALTEPVIRADFLLLEEGQDTNHVLEKVFTAQRDHAQLIMVGDSAQAIYGWRGAYDVMTDFDGVQLTLTQSFRFGRAVADEANRRLTILAAPLRPKGAPAPHSTVGPVDHPNAVLCRSNSGAICEVLRLLRNNKRVAMAGGEALVKLTVAAGQLKASRRTSHPELCLSTSWEELHEYATSDPAGGDLLPLVDIVDEYGPDLVVAVVRNLHPEHAADVVVSTGHKAKGREWPTATIGTDFEPRPGSKNNSGDSNGQPDLDPAEARLAYVTVTRARERLDLGGLSWINHRFSAPGTTDGPVIPPDASPSPWDRLGPLSADRRSDREGRRPGVVSPFRRRRRRSGP
ncbi:UvrD-helicase domain-containing protein [Streptomyces sp. NPDC050211]|uniref:UvrD-helicase domain-containing protein n=1 Tax=Streptomyces sp. NPDC050211 TaxID=3154932 RepID=UPI00344861A3